MSLPCNSEIQSLRDRKNASKYDECKIKATVSRRVYAFPQNEILLLSQCPFTDFLNTLKSQGKAGAIFSLAPEKGPTLLFYNFGQAIQNMLNMSKHYFFIQTQMFHAVIRKEQAQRRRPI